MTKSIVIIGTGGNCTDILDTILDINDANGELIYECKGFLDDDPSKINQIIHNVNIIGNLKMASQIKDSLFVFGIGSEKNYWNRKKIFEKIGLDDNQFETIIHPTASVSKMASLGIGTVIFQNAVITSGVIIGRHVVILPNTVISHDDIIGDFTCIAGGVCVSGKVTVGEGCYLGSNSSIKNGVAIGNHSLIGIGSVVLEDIPENHVVVGNPARFLRFTETQ